MSERLYAVWHCHVYPAVIGKVNIVVPAIEAAGMRMPKGIPFEHRSRAWPFWAQRFYEVYELE